MKAIWHHAAARLGELELFTVLFLLMGLNDLADKTARRSGVNSFLLFNGQQTATGLPVYIFRNTFVGEAQWNRVNSTNGPFHWYVNETTFPEKIERRNIDGPTRLIISNNLVGNTANNIVDSQGNLTPAYSAFVGTRGHQVGLIPLTPTNVQVQ